MNVPRGELDKYRMLAEHSRDIMLFIEPNGRIIEANDAAVSAYGYSRDELLALTIFDLRASDAPLQTASQMAEADSGGIIFETTHRRKDGSCFDVEVSSRGADVGGERVLLSVIRDITERKLAEEALSESERRLSVIFDSIADGFYAFDREWKVTHMNDEALRYFGWSREETIGRALYELFPGYPGSAFELYYRQAMETGEPVVFETPSIITDRTVEVHAYPGSDNITILLRDVTDRKRAQEAMRESEERYRLLFSGMTEGFALHEIICDQAGKPCDYRFLDINPAFEQLTGLKREDVVGRTVQEILPDNDPYWVEIYGKVALTGESVHFENYASVLNRHYEVLAYSPSPRQFAVIFTDVTERKQAAEALRESEERLRLAQDVAGIGVWEWSPQSGQTVWSPEIESIYGVAQGTMTDYASWQKLVHPEDLSRVEAETADAIASRRRFDLEFRIIRPSGELRWVTTLGGAIYDGSGAVVRAFGVNLDITERKQAEEALSESRDRFEVLTRNLRSGVALIDGLGKFSIVNPAFLSMFDLPDESSIANVNDRNWVEYRVFDEHEELLDVDEHPVRKAAMTGKAVRNKLVGVRSPAGEDIRWMLISAEPVIKPDGEMDALICTYHDVTERKHAEEALRQSEERFRLALEHSPVSVAVQDRDLVYQWAYNQRSRRTDEIIGRTDADLFAPEDLDWILEVKRRVLESGTKEHVQRWLTSNGRRVFLDLTYEPLRDSAGEITGIGIAVVELTEQRRAEEALQDSLRLLDDVIDGSTSPIFLKDREGKFITINASLERMLGMTRGELKDKTDYDIAPKEAADRWRVHDTRVITTGEAIQVEETADLQDGHHIFLANKFPLVDAEGQIYGVGSISHDITERKQLEQEKEDVYNRERRISEMLQQALIPSQIPTVVSGCHFAAKYVPALSEALVGGDFYDVFDLGGGRVAVLIGDVAGKGVRAAMQVSAARYAFRSYAYIEPSPSRVVSLVNDALCKGQGNEVNMLTAFFAVVDTNNNTVYYTNGGHEPAVIRRASGVVEELNVGARALGILPGCDYPEASLKLEPGDLIVFVTDGITEARSEERGMFGKSEMLRFLAEQDAAAPELVNLLLEKAREYGNGQLQDDVAIVALELEKSCVEVGL